MAEAEEAVEEAEAEAEAEVEAGVGAEAEVVVAGRCRRVSPSSVGGWCSGTGTYRGVERLRGGVPARRGGRIPKTPVFEVVA